MGARQRTTETDHGSRTKDNGPRATDNGPQTTDNGPRTTRAIVRPPTPNFHQGITTSNLGLPDFPTALLQHKAYCKALNQCGLTVTVLDPDPRYPDSTFIEDTAVIAADHAIITRPGADSRIGEAESIAKCLSEFFPQLDSIEPPGTLDGGDVCQVESHFFVGISLRTNQSGAKQLSKVLKSHGYTSSHIDIRRIEGVLHLKSGLSYLRNNQLVVTESLADIQAFSEFELIQVPKGAEYAANCLYINNYVLAAAGFPEFKRLLKAKGYNVITLDVTEFQKMDGGLSCLSLRW